MLPKLDTWFRFYEPIGVLNYDEWLTPPYREYYQNEEFKIGDKTVFISNKFNLEHGHKPYGFFDIEFLHDVFHYLASKGYTVIYKRPLNTEFIVDQNELRSDVRNEYYWYNVEGIGILSDKDIPKYFDNVYLFDDLLGVTIMSTDENYGKRRLFY